MDRRQRVFNPEETTRMAMDGRAAQIWTSLPGVVTSFNPTQWTVNVQPTIKTRVMQSNGVWESVSLPTITDCPVCFLGGGGMTSFFPISEGDEALLVFCSRCIDAWWFFGPADGSDPAFDPPEYRMHDLSDGFALVGIRSLPNVIVDLPSGVGGVISDDGSTSIQLNPTARTVGITAPGGINFNGLQIDSSGNVTTPGGITADDDVVAGGTGGISLKNHTHTSEAEGSPTSPPIAS